MARKLKALQALSLLTVLSGASVLVLSAGTAQAGEERLHNESTLTYGLLPPGTSSTAQDTVDGGDGSAAMSVASLSTPITKGGPGKDDVPDLEDPELPGYDGGEAPSAARASR